MKITLFSILAVVLIALAVVPNSFAQSYTQWNLPEGAIARFGKGIIRELTYSPDETQLAVASSVGVWVYDAQTEAVLEWLTPDPSKPRRFRSVAYSPDGRTLASGSVHDVHLWDTATWQSRDILSVPPIENRYADIQSIRYSPDGRILACAGYADNAIRLWDTRTGKILRTLQGHTSDITGIAFSPDGRTLASGSGDTTVRLWDVGSGRLIANLTGHTKMIGSVSFSPDGRTLASGGWDGKIILWDAGTGRFRSTLTEHWWGESTSFSPDGTIFVSSHWDGKIRVWDATTGQVKATFESATAGEIQATAGYAFSVGSLMFQRDGRTLAGVSRSGTIHFWDVRTGQITSTIKGYTKEVVRVVYSPDGGTLAIGADSGVQLWDIATEQLKPSPPTRSNWGDTLAYSPDGLTLAVATQKVVHLWDVRTGRQKVTLTGHTEWVWCVAYSPDGRTIAGGGGDSTVRLWDARSGAHKATLRGHTAHVQSVSFSPNGSILASGGYNDDTVRVWDVGTGRLLHTLGGHIKGGVGITFSPDGKTLAVETPGERYNDAKVVLWDVATGQRKAALPISRSCYYSGVSFSPDGTMLVTGGNGAEILFWDVATGERFKVLYGHAHWIESLAFSPDGTTLATGSPDGTVLLWDVTPIATQRLQRETDSQKPKQNTPISQTEDDTAIQQYEREMVRLVYFRPSDRSHRQGIEKELDTLIRWTQYFYAEQMQGIGNRKTFAFETEPTGYAQVHHVTGKFTDTYYHQDTYNKVLNEIAEQFDTSKNVFLVAIDVSSEFINNENTCGIGGGGWNSSDNENWRRDFGGLAVIPASGVCINPSITAHELGHVFGLEHDFRDNAYLMGYGTQQRLSHCATEWLDAHRFFNNDPIFFNENATIAMRASNASNPRTLRLQFELNDADGLRQAQLLVPVAATDPASGLKLHSCKSLNGKRQTVEFVTTDLTVGVDSEITLQVIDVSGNITKQTFPLTIEDTSNRSPVAIGTIPAQTLTVGSTMMLNMSSYFNDPDNDVLSYEVESTNTGVVTVRTLGTQIAIVPRGVGNSTVAITASDGTSRVVRHITVQVEDVRVTETIETDSVIGTIHADDLVLYLPFDAGVGTTATDASKHSNNGIVHNARWVQGKNGEAIELTGQRGSWVEVPDSPSLDITDEITLMAWVHPTRFTHEWLRIIVKTWAGDTAPWMVYGLYQQGGSNGKTGFIMSVDGGREVRCGNGPSPQLPLNQWTHLTATYDGNRMKLYYNGELKVETAATGRIDTNDVPLSIGRNSEGNREHYIGLIDEVAIWNVALDVSEIKRAMGADASVTPIATTRISDNFDDSFEGTALQNPNWQWQNEPANWDVGETRSNFLHIEGETNRNQWTSDTSHFLYQETDADTFDVETHFFARWDTTAGVNGLVVKSPTDNNWVTLKFWSQGPGAKGRIQYQTRGREHGDGLTGNAGFTPTHGDTELFFRLRKDGDAYTGWYKTRAAEPWIEIGVTHFPLTPPLQLGIYAGVAAQTGTLVVDYEYFRSTTGAVQAAPAIHLSAVQVPEDTTLLPNYPNPFNPETWIPYQLSNPADVTVHIYGIDGRLVRYLSLGHQAAGMYRGRSRAVYWDGRNEFGEPVASGIYFYTLTAGDYTATRKMLIRK